MSELSCSYILLLFISRKILSGFLERLWKEKNTWKNILLNDNSRPLKPKM